MRKVLGLGALVLLAPAGLAADPARGPASDTPIPICRHQAPTAPSQPSRTLLTGYGTGGFAIRTANAKAQAFFDNGMQLAHAFAHKAAIGAFQEAETLDPACAMCVWGEAWSRGPTINYRIEPGEQKQLRALVQKAAGLARGAPPKERRLIAALQFRYVNGGGKGPGDLAFARAMDALARDYPEDNEIAVMAADAWMIPAAQADNRNTLPRALELLEGALARNPNDTGAIHFYIHATEMSGFGAKALPYAERLQALAPAASHLVHMPSHTYFWVGRYRQAERSNLDAAAIDRANAKRLALKDGAFGLMYHAHNVQFGTGAALMDGDAGPALTLSDSQLAELPKTRPGDFYRQLVLGTAYFGQGRYADPAKVFALADPGPGLPYARAMWRYARGEAAARNEDAKAVRAEAAAVALTPGELQTFGGSAHRADTMVQIARLVLLGRAAMLERRYAEAADAYGRAARLQEASLGPGGDPPAWWYPVRRSLAAAELAGGQSRKAAADAQASLSRWPWDPLALLVLSRSQEAAGRKVEAERNVAVARAGWAGDLARVPAAAL